MSVAYKKNGTEIPITSAIMGGGVGFLDTGNLIHSITTAGASWTASENCWAICGIAGTDQRAGQVFVDNVLTVGQLATTAANSTVPIKKGQVLSTRATYGTYDIKIYGMK